MSRTMLVLVIFLSPLALLAREPKPIVHGDWELPNQNPYVSKEDFVKPGGSQSYTSWSNQHGPGQLLKVHLFRGITEVTYRELNSGLGAVGIVHAVDSKTGGTAFVVPSNGQPFDIIIGVAHDFFDENCELKSDQFNFYYGGTANANRKVKITDVVVGTRCVRHSRTYDRQAYAEDEVDWAIALLENKKTSQQYGTLTAASVTGPINDVIAGKRARIYTVGYHPDQRRLMKSQPCVVYDEHQYDFENLIFMDCSTDFGWSGGPVILEMDNKLYAIGTITRQAPVKPLNPKDGPNVAIRIHTDFKSALIAVRDFGRNASRQFGRNWIKTR